jgi:methyltransferase
MTPLYIIIILVASLRLAELLLSAHNTRLLKANGGIEIGARHYPLFVLLHGSWLLAIVLLTPANAAFNGWLLFAFAILQVGRLWVIASLGRFWTTRIITVPGAPLVKKGPYRFVSHPNYIIVTAEIALLPLVFGNWQIAIIWSVLNASLLSWRIHVENRILAERKLLKSDNVILNYAGL